MKVLQINCVYGYGSTGKIVESIHKQLTEKKLSSVVCYGRGKRVDGYSVYKVCGELEAKAYNLFTRATGIMYGGCFFSTERIISIIKKENPDIVHLHCINGYFVNIYKLISWLNVNRIKTVLTLHAEFMYTANCGHAYECEGWKSGCGNCRRYKEVTKSAFFDRTHSSWKKMKKAFDGFDSLKVISVSPWLMSRAIQSPIMKDLNHSVVLNGLDTTVFTEKDVSELRNKHNIRDEKIIFHATPVFNDDKDNIKGGYYIIELAKKMLNSNVKFIIAGKYPKDLIVPENIILLGNVADTEVLAQYYSLADVTVIASKRETFSMVVAESLCCGTPVVGFLAGAPEQIALEDYSSFVPYGDINELEKQCRFWIERNVDEKILGEKAKKKYSEEKMTSEYMKIYCAFEKECN